MPENGGLIRLTSNYFCAGVVVRNGTIVRTAPILRWMRSKKVGWLRQYAAGRGWRFELVSLSKAKNFDETMEALKSNQTNRGKDA